MPRPPPILVLNIFFGKLVPNQICVPNLKLLASTVGKIRRGSQIFFDAPCPTPPPILVLNVVFGKLVPNPSCVLNLKLLASTVPKICRGPKFCLDAPLAQIPANFGSKRFLVS